MREKRQNKRIKKDFSILCRIYKKIGIEGDLSHIIDISKSGLCFITDTQLDTDDILHITFRIPPEFKKKIELFSKIIESKKINDTKFKIRASFIDISPDTKIILEAMIEQSVFKEMLNQNSEE